MAGPNQRSIRKALVPAGEAQTLYQPDLLAKEIRNFVRTTEGTLRSVRGPAIYEPDRGGAYPLSNEPHGIWQGSLLGGIDDTILIRIGATLRRVSGWNQGATTIRSGLTDETLPTFPDRFVHLSNKVIWTNGIDRALVITHDGMVTPLGFDRRPASPQVQGPEQAPYGPAVSSEYPNSRGYSWPGRVGTVGDESEGQAGVILAGEWLYYLAAIDVHGNVGPASVASNPAKFHTINADPYDANSKNSYDEHGFEVDDLTKQFRVLGGGDAADEHCVGWLLYRTPDARNVGTTPQLVTRLPGRRQINYSDSHSDSELGPVMDDFVPVPVFRVACAYQSCLVIGNTPGDPGLLRKSEPGLPGTYSRLNYCYPDEGGGAVTGVASHGGRLIAFTATAVFDCTDFQRPVALARGIGCAAPASIVAHPSGLLIWLSRDGFYGLAPGGLPMRLTDSQNETIFNDISQANLALAVAEIHPVSDEYICFLPPAGSVKNTLGLAYDGVGWRRYELGIDVKGLARTYDWRGYLLLFGRSQNGIESIFVFDRETSAWDAPNKASALYKSANLYGDELGLYPVHVHELWVGMVDAYDGEATIRLYRNGEPVAASEQVFRLMGPDGLDASTPSAIYRDIASRAVVGTAVAHDRRLTWRRIPVNFRRVTTWRFEIEVAYPAQINLVAFAFSVSTETNGAPLATLPGKEDA